jgi:hypothetical protein
MKSFFVKFLQQKITIFYHEAWVLKKMNSRCLTSENWAERAFHISNDPHDPPITYMDVQFKVTNEEFFSFVENTRLSNIRGRPSDDVFSKVFELENDIAYYTIAPEYTLGIALVIFKKVSNNILVFVLFECISFDTKQLDQCLLLVNNMKLG